MPFKSREAQRAASKRHYEANRDTMIARARAHGDIARQRIRDWLLAYLIEHPCVDCGEADPIVLEFDHRGDKAFNLGSAARSRRGLASIQAEVAKCDVRCANCHRRKTYAERGFSHRNAVAG